MKKIKEFLKSDEAWLYIPVIGMNVLFLIAVSIAMKDGCY